MAKKFCEIVPRLNLKEMGVASNLCFFRSWKKFGEKNKR
jgi:hypothetical protein